MLERALKIKEAHYGNSHPQVALTLFNLGMSKLQLSQFMEGYAYVSRAHRMMLSTPGYEHHPHTQQMASTLQEFSPLMAQFGDVQRNPTATSRALPAQTSQRRATSPQTYPSTSPTKFSQPPSLDALSRGFIWAGDVCYGQAKPEMALSYYELAAKPLPRLNQAEPANKRLAEIVNSKLGFFKKPDIIEAMEVRKAAKNLQK